VSASFNGYFILLVCSNIGFLLPEHAFFLFYISVKFTSLTTFPWKEGNDIKN
jgi:hypothetical protein